jgi:t-SNARE complex subunit (syntaxin)
MAPDDLSRLVRVEQHLEDLWQLVNGGPNVEWKQSIRGRLHDVQQRLASEEALTQAIREVRRTQTRRLATWAQIVLVLCGVVTALAAVIAAVAQLTG